MAHVNYHGWRTQNSQIYRDWRRIEAIMKHVRFDRSPFVPKTFEAYVKHRSEMALQMAEENQVKVKQNQIEEDIAEEHGRKYPLSAFGGKRIFNGRVGVMGSQTIWAYHWTPDPASPEAPWPNLDEYREEGDERHTSTFGRFLPIPRVPGNPTVVWKQKAFKVPYPHDQVNPVAKKYDIPLPNEYFNEFEPEYDIHGIPIDDPEDFGRTATVSRPSSTRRGSAVDVPVPQTAGMYDKNLCMSQITDRDKGVQGHATSSWVAFLKRPRLAALVPARFPSTQSYQNSSVKEAVGWPEMITVIGAPLALQGTQAETTLDCAARPKEE